MFPRILAEIREHVRTGQYMMTIHGEEEMNADAFSIFDVEHALLTGSIISRQRDKDIGEWKYILEGTSLDGRPVGVVTKLSPTRKLVIITVYGEEG